ncbi:MAG: ABC transporter substrate-binding protein [Betaproteobacteria bacterium]|nr:ABC transporter substrate-binding protein [Betaproteobacteria bacterium]
MLLVASGSGCTQGVGRMRKIGWLTMGSSTSHACALAAFREGLAELGWIDGRNVVIELRWAEGRPERLPGLAAETVQSKPDVILTASNAVSIAMRKATATIPIVMATGSDPVAAGLADSLARPGGNVTGLTGFCESTPHKMLEIVAGLVPRDARVVALLDGSSSTAVWRQEMRSKLEQSAAAAGLRLQWPDAATTEAMIEVVAGLAGTVLRRCSWFRGRRCSPQGRASWNRRGRCAFRPSIRSRRRSRPEGS